MVNEDVNHRTAQNYPVQKQKVTTEGKATMDAQVSYTQKMTVNKKV